MLDCMFGIAVLFILLLFTIAVYLYVSGLFETIEVHVKSPPYLSKAQIYAYKTHEGAYDQTGYLFTEAYSVCPTVAQCGIHFEDEKQETDTSDLPKSFVGAFIRPDDEASIEAFKDADFRLVELPAIDEALVVSFPHTSLASIPIGSRRVYNRMKSYIKEHELNVTGFLEVYDGQRIHYIGLLKNVDAFRLSEKAAQAPTLHAAQVHPPVETLTASTVLHSVAQPDSHCDSSGSEDLEASFEKITDASGLPTSG